MNSAEGSKSLPRLRSEWTSPLLTICFCGRGDYGVASSMRSTFQGSAAGSNRFQAPLVGANAGLLSGNGFILDGLLYGLTGVQNPTSSAFVPRTYGATIGFQVSQKMAWNGTGSLAVAMANPNNLVYINGKTEAAGITSTGSSAGLMTAGAYQIGGAANGGLPTWFNGQVYYVAFWNRVLNPSEIAQSANFMANAMAARGVIQSLTATNSVSQIVTDGDSITAGNGTNPAWPYALTIGGSAVQVENIGQSAWTMSGMQAVADLQVDTQFRANAERNAVIVWGGTNDLGVATSAATWPFLQSYCRARKLAGWKVLVVSMISRGGTGLSGTSYDTLKNQYNALIRSNWTAWADGLVDLGGTTQLGADGANVSTTFFQDTIHPTQNSVYNVEAPIFNRAIARLYGAQDFSSANVYSSAAPAATATTAGSQSTNTVTLTFTSNPFVAGNVITVSGVTPAGYNGTFTVLSANATQVTYYNFTTGLGVITVQGTVSSPQQLDGDKYIILNFGAGNFTLNSCQGYTGQNIYIQNINASNSTLVPFGSETITGAGATPTTLTANTTAILQSRLVSPAAGGCNWVRLQ